MSKGLYQFKTTRRNSLPVSTSYDCLIAKDEGPDYEDDGEDERLGKKGPLPTVLTMSIGPLTSQMVIAFYGIVNSLWVAQTIGSDGVEVFGAVFIVEFIATAIAEYLLTCVALRASFCFGEQKGTKVAQLFVDFIRIALIFGIITPCIVLPLTKPLVKWFGAGPKLADMCFQYMLPPTLGCFFNYVYQMALGLIQAEGRSILFGIIQLISFGLNISFLAITMLWLHLPIWGASLSTICSQGIPGIVIIFLFFGNKFSTEPKFKMFFKKFSDETKPALKIGLASLIVGISYSLPLILMQKYVNDAASAIGVYDTVIQVWGVIEKVYAIVGGICIGFNYGFVPAASYAYGAKLWPRVKQLALHMLWVSTLISCSISVVLIFWPDKIASFWNKDPAFLFWSKKMIPRVFYACIFIALQYMVPGLLQAMQLVLDATVLSFVTLLMPYPIFSTVLYFTDKKDPARVLFTYCLSDCFSCLVCSICLCHPFGILKKNERNDSILVSENYISENFSDKKRRHSISCSKYTDL